MIKSIATVLGRRGNVRTATLAMGAVRNLNVHEYISLEIMKQHGIKVPKGFVASTPEEAEHVFSMQINRRTLMIYI